MNDKEIKEIAAALKVIANHIGKTKMDDVVKEIFVNIWSQMYDDITENRDNMYAYVKSTLEREDN